MTKNALWTVLAVVGAIIVAWVLVEILFSVLGLLFGVLGFFLKLVIVALVALAVYWVLRNIMGRSAD